MNRKWFTLLGRLARTLTFEGRHGGWPRFVRGKGSHSRRGVLHQAVIESLERRIQFSTYQISGPVTAFENSPYQLSLATTSTTIQSWTINWGDGTQQSPDTTTVQGNPSSVQHTYASTGSEIIFASALDLAGSHATNTSNLQVLPPLAASEVAGVPVTAGQSEEITLAGIDDTYGDYDSALYSVSVDWGDGTPMDNDGFSTGRYFSSNDFDIGGFHTFSTPGTYTQTITVNHDGDPNSTFVLNRSVVVTGSPIVSAVPVYETAAPQSIATDWSGNTWYYDGSNVGIVGVGPLSNNFTGIVGTSGRDIWATGSNGTLSEMAYDGLNLQIIATYGEPTVHSAYDPVEGWDGGIWFIDPADNAICAVTTSGTLSTYSIPTANSGAADLTVDPQTQQMLFSEQNTGKIGTVSANGTIHDQAAAGNNNLTVSTDGTVFSIGNQNVYAGITSSSVQQLSFPTGLYNTNWAFGTRMVSTGDNGIWFTVENAQCDIVLGHITKTSNNNAPWTVAYTHLATAAGQFQLSGLVANANGSATFVENQIDFMNSAIMGNVTEDNTLSQWTFPAAWVDYIASDGYGNLTVYDSLDGEIIPVDRNTGSYVNFRAGQNLTRQLAYFRNDLTSSNPTDYTVTVNWGDNSTSSASVSELSSGYFSINGAHQYVSSGTYPITITLSDVEGQSSVITSTAYASAGPTIHGAAGVVIGSPYTLTLSAAAPITHWTVNWGDGTQSAINGNPSSAQHVYLQTKSYTVSATATDSLGTYTSNAASVTAILPSRVTVISAATATLDPATHAQATLNVAASSQFGNSDLVYTWLADNSAPALVYFSDNGDNTASTTTAVFSAAGTYHFTVLVTAPDGTTASSTVTLTVNQSLSLIHVTSSQVVPVVGGTQQFIAAAYDQFGNAMVAAPVFTWSVTGSGYSISNAGLLTAGSVIGSYSVKASSGGISSSPASYSPTISIVSPASAILDSSGSFAQLAVLATDTTGGADLIYNWAVTSGNADDVLFADNDDNSSSSNLAYFSSSGTYTLTVTTADGNGHSLTSSVVLNVGQVLTSISAATLDGVPSAGATQHFSATAYDQFGQPLATQPQFTWAVDNTQYSIAGSGILTAGGGGGDYNVVASSGGVRSTALAFSPSVSVVNPPTAAIDSGSPTKATLNVLGGDLAGESTLTYTWASVGNSPAGVTFSNNGTNSAKSTRATFLAAGVYQFQVILTDEDNHSTTSNVTLTVNQVLSDVEVNTSVPTPAPGGTQQFSATAYDQFGNVMATQPSFTWAVTGSGYTISSAGLLTAGATVGSYSVTASNGSITSNAVAYSQSISLTHAASATLDSTSTYADLHALATDHTGGSDLTYTWTVTSGSAADVSFYDNGDNSASHNLAYFSAAGMYTFLVTAKDTGGNTTTSSVSVTVAQVLTGITITTTQPTAGAYGTQQFSSVAYDQFGHALASQPALSWATTGTGYTVSSSGLVTGGSTAEDYTVTAYNGSIESNTLSFSPAITSYAYSSGNSTGTTATLSASAYDTTGDTDLTYVWTVSGNSPSGVSFSDNASNSANNVTATFSQGGTYTFLLEVVDSNGLETTASVSLTVNQTLTSIVVTPASGPPAAHGMQQFAATGYDQFGMLMATQPAFTSWSVSGTGYSISSSGLLTAGSSVGSYRVSLSSGAANATLSFGSVLAVKSAATVTLDSSKTFATLSALGEDSAGGQDLTYSWTLTGANANDADFSDNYSSSASKTTAFFYAPGVYDFQVTISDPAGNSVESAVAVTVQAAITSIDISTSDSLPTGNGTQQFTATAYDQFGGLLLNLGSMNWSVDGDGYSIDETSGLLTSSGGQGNYTVTATALNGTTGSTDPGMLAPVISTAPSAGTFDPLGTSVPLTAAAFDMSGTEDLTFSWSASGNNAAFVRFSGDETNEDSIATFSRAGTYDLVFTATSDTGLSVTAPVSVVVTQQLGSISISPTAPIVPTGDTYQLSAAELDQFGDPLINIVPLTWSTSGCNTVSSSGFVTAGQNSGTFDVTAQATTSNGPVIGTTPLLVKGTALQPRFNGASATTNANTAVTVNALAGATNGDENNDPYLPTYTFIETPPAHGYATIANNGMLTYTPNLGFTGNDTLRVYSANADWAGGVETVNIQINPLTATYSPPNPAPDWSNFKTGSFVASATKNTPVTLSWIQGGHGQVTYDLGNGEALTVGYQPTGSDPNSAVQVNFDGSTVSITGGDEEVNNFVAISADLAYTSPLSATWTGCSGPSELSISAITVANVAVPGNLDIKAFNVITGNVSAGGSIDGLASKVTGTVAAGASISLAVGLQDCLYDFEGTISAGADLDLRSFGNITSAARLSAGASMNLDVAGSVGGTITAHGNLTIRAFTEGDYYKETGPLPAGLGGITANITDTGGNISLQAYAAITGTISGTDVTGLYIEDDADVSSNITLTLAAPTDGEPDYISISANGSFTGTLLITNANNLSAEDAAISVYALAGISGNITASRGSISDVFTFGDLSGNVIAEDGSVGDITAQGAISGGISGLGIDSITAGSDMTSPFISGGSGDIGTITVGRDLNSPIDTTGNITVMTVGRDYTGLELDVHSLGSLRVGRDLSVSINALINIGSIVAGANITSGMIHAGEGAIGTISAGTYSGIAGGWQDQATAWGNISGGSIVADMTIGDVTAYAAPGYDAFISNETIRSGNGTLGNITAVSGISGTIEALGANSSIGRIATTYGDIAGNITATNGNISAITLSDGSLLANLTAGGSIGDLTISGSINGNITATNGNIGNITASNGSVGNTTTGTTKITASNGNIGNLKSGSDIADTIAAPNGTIGNIAAVGNVTKNISAGKSLGTLSIGGNLSGSITAASSIGAMLVGGSLSGNVSCTAGSIGTISAYGGIASNIFAKSGTLTLTSYGNITGSISSGGDVVLYANGDMAGQVATAAGSATLVVGGNLSLQSSSANQPLVKAYGNVYVFALGNVTGDLISQSGQAYELAGGTVKGNVNAPINVVAIDSLIDLDDGDSLAEGPSSPGTPASDASNSALASAVASAGASASTKMVSLLQALQAGGGHIFAGQVEFIRLTPAEVQSIITSVPGEIYTAASVAAGASYWDKIAKKDADAKYPYLAPAIRYKAIADDLNLARAKAIVLLRSPGLNDYVTELYKTVRAFNPTHFVAEESFALGQGWEPVLNVPADRTRTLIGLLAYFAVLKGGQFLGKGLSNVKGYYFSNPVGEVAPYAGVQFASGGRLNVIEGYVPDEAEAEAAITLANDGEAITLKPINGPRSPAGGTADAYVLRGQQQVPYDVKTPISSNTNAVFRDIRDANSQAQGVILDLRKTTVTLEELGNVMARLNGGSTPATNIQEVIVVEQNGTIVHLLRKN